MVEVVGYSSTLRRKALVAALLVNNSIFGVGKQACRFIPIDISGQYHPAIRSSFHPVEADTMMAVFMGEMTGYCIMNHFFSSNVSEFPVLSTRIRFVFAFRYS